MLMSGQRRSESPTRPFLFPPFPPTSRRNGNVSLDFGIVRVLWLTSSVSDYPHGDGRSPDQTIINKQAAPPPDLRLPFGAKEVTGEGDQP